MPPSGVVNAGEHLSERALARAVLTTDRVTGAGRDVEADVRQRGDAGKALGDVRERDHAPTAAHFIAMNFGSTSVKPQSRSCRAHCAEVALVDAHEIHLHVLRHVLLVVHVIVDRLHRHVAPLIRRLREQHRRDALLDVRQLRRQPVDRHDLHLLRIEIGEQRLGPQCPAADHRPAVACPGYAFIARTTSAAASCGVST